MILRMAGMLEFGRKTQSMGMPLEIDANLRYPNH